MVQGSNKLHKRGPQAAVVNHKKSAGSVRKKATRQKAQLSKGRKHFDEKQTNHPSVSTVVALQQQQRHHAYQETTKAINKRNETLIAAKAVSAGTRFFIQDIANRGSREIKQQVKDRNKKQEGSRLTDRLQKQLKKLEKNV